ncbi:MULTISPECIES: hypothetical protein [unclassified Cryobacterium]|uniref:hypothetical protein n=1 Tax=unclassified Cryobacterium TaxID=2649013 RepID=UPI00106C6D3A|nr:MULTISPECIES: hypothetical protein [unclassified Cryobacterium]TFC00267.1 hypothetical protein E3O39_01785 [Cryobacterium sp. MDB2-A-1]TFC13323.1 hypothetical protein E3O51_16820 [Cryobacterium sp. MDB2-10]TFC14131.1 hypothetical protein E3O35_04055 [Cryobacterium sp. MDB2-A-2]
MGDSAAKPADAVGNVAGYRVLRRIGSGDLSDVYLGASAEGGIDGQREVVVLKVFREVHAVGAGTGGAAIDREVRALESIPDGGVGRLLDVATLPDGRVCLVLAEDRGGALGAVLAGERLLDPGEAVTILAPVLAAVARLYDGGWLHPGISPGVIRFDGAGRPVVGGLGGLRDLPPPGQDRDELQGEARCACGDVVQTVLDRVAKRGQPPADALFAAWRSGTYREALAGLERALFEWSPAAPVRFGGHDVAPGHGTSTDIRGRSPGQGPLTSLEAALDAHVWPLLRAWAVQVAGTIGGRLTGIRRVVPAPRAHRGRAAHSFGPGTRPGPERSPRPSTRRGTWTAADDPARWRRRGLILAGASVAVILVVGAWTALAPPSLSSGAHPSSVGAVPPRSALGSGEGPATGPTTADQVVLRGEDPAAATAALLRIRALCLVTADRDCLAEVSQPDSPALAGASALIGHAPDGATGSATGYPHDSSAPTVDGSVPTVVNRIGNLALVALSVGGAAPGNDKPASVLVVKGEAGWRLREFFGAG